MELSGRVGWQETEHWNDMAGTDVCEFWGGIGVVDANRRGAVRLASSYLSA